MGSGEDAAARLSPLGGALPGKGVTGRQSSMMFGVVLGHGTVPRESWSGRSQSRMGPDCGLCACLRDVAHGGARYKSRVYALAGSSQLGHAPEGAAAPVTRTHLGTMSHRDLESRSACPPSDRDDAS